MPKISFSIALALFDSFYVGPLSDAPKIFTFPIIDPATLDWKLKPSFVLTCDAGFSAYSSYLSVSPTKQLLGKVFQAPSSKISTFTEDRSHISISDKEQIF